MVFDAIGFELDLLNERQSTFIAPDSTQFHLVPGLSALTCLLIWHCYVFVAISTLILSCRYALKQYFSQALLSFLCCVSFNHKKKTLRSKFVFSLSAGELGVRSDILALPSGPVLEIH